MKVKLEIEHSDGIMTGEDMERALGQLSAELFGENRRENICRAGSGEVMDLKGRSTGKWEITTEDQPAITTLPRTRSSALVPECDDAEVYLQQNQPATRCYKRRYSRSSYWPAFLSPDVKSATVPLCPKCGETRVFICVEAEANFILEGWDERGEIVADFDEPIIIDTFDRFTHRCQGCGHKSNDSMTFAPGEYSAASSSTSEVIIAGAVEPAIQAGGIKMTNPPEAKVAVGFSQGLPEDVCHHCKSKIDKESLIFANSHNHSVLCKSCTQKASGPLPTRNELLMMVRERRAVHTVNRINHEEFVAGGIIYCCDWESPGFHYSIPNPGRWVTYKEGPQNPGENEAEIL